MRKERDNSKNKKGYESKYNRNVPYYPNPRLDTKQRVQQVLELIRKGWSKSRIIDKIMKDWNLTKTPAWRYYHDAIVIISEKFDETVEDIKNIQLERIESILKSALESNDRRNALSAIDMINKLYALYVEKQEVKADISEWKFKFGNNETENENE